MYKYQTFSVVSDNGPYITKLILHMPVEVQESMVDPETFNVYVERKNPHTGEIFMASRVWLGPKIYPSKGYREVTKAYPCDDSGKKVFCSDKVALEMPWGPLYPLGYMQAALTKSYNEFVRSEYRVTQIKEIRTEIPATGLVFDDYLGDICPQLTGWQNDISHDKKMPLRYGYFTPDLEHAKKAYRALDSNYGDQWEHPFPEKLPLVVWLHGLGEGGSQDATVAYTGNKVVNLSSDDIQRKLGGAAYILAPQCPTFWMDSGKPDAKGSHDELISRHSCYTEAVKACIDEFIEAHEDIDTDRIYIGGCSNGGFMTVNMLVHYPDFFAAAYPTCEAYRNSDFTEQDVENLKHLPIWFVNAENDPLVPPDSSPIPLYQRLKKAGNTNVHCSLFEDIYDQSGLFKDEEGKPWKYVAHFSWVHVYNDFVQYDLDGTRVMHEGRPVTLWRWLGKQRKTK